MQVVNALLLLLLSSKNAEGFLQEFIPKAFTTTTTNNPKHVIDRIQPTTDALVGQELEVRLEVGPKNSPQRMSVQQLLLRLDETEIHPTTNKKKDNALIKHGKTAKDSTTTPAPPAAIVIPLTTTGKSDIVHTMTVQKTGSFINHAGLQSIALDRDTALWELIWDSPDSPAGTLVLGLDIQQDATRNDATIKKGHIFISFPVWTRDGILEYQQRKADVEMAANVHLVERDVQIEKYKTATNIIAKLLHYRNAAAAVERYSLYPTRAMASIPDDDDLIPLANGNLFLTKTGTIWRNPEKQTFMASGQPVQDGTASIKVSKTISTSAAPIARPFAATL